MRIVGGLDVHRPQITFDYLDERTGQWAAPHFPDCHLIDCQAASWLLRYSSWTSCQGPCKVSFAGFDLRLWRPAAGVRPPESRLCPGPAWSALGSCPGQSDLVVDLAPRRPRLDTDRSLSTPASAQFNRLSDDLHEPWLRWR